MNTTDNERVVVRVPAWALPTSFELLEYNVEIEGGLVISNAVTLVPCETNEELVALIERYI